MSSGVTDEPMPRDAFVSIFSSMLGNARYFCAASIHAIRRQLGKKADERYTEVQRSQHLTQGDVRVFGQSYMANTSSVDGQAAYLGEEADHRHIEYFQGMERFHEDGLPCRLPARLEDEVHRDPQLVKLEQEARLADSRNASSARAQAASCRKTLTRAALQQYQEEWVRQRRDWKVATRGCGPSTTTICKEDGFVHSLCLLFPERGRLVPLMAADRPLQSDEMWRAMDDLYTLCRRDTSVLYLPGHQPINGHCPVKCCQLGLTSFTKRTRNAHFQDCVRRELASQHQHLQTEVHYCHLCFCWVLGSDRWSQHCTSHLKEYLTKMCGPVTYCHTLVRPGYCPFCLGDESLSASRRLESWTRSHKLWTHILGHVQACTWPFICPYPSCETDLKNETDFQYHLVDDHGLCRPSNTQTASMSEVVSSSKRKRMCDSNQQSVEWLSIETAEYRVLSKKARREEFGRHITTVTPSEDTQSLVLNDSDDQASPIFVAPQEAGLHASPTQICFQSPVPQLQDNVHENIFFHDFIRSPSPETSENADLAISPNETTMISAKADISQSRCTSEWAAERSRPRLKFAIRPSKAKIILRLPALKRGKGIKAKTKAEAEMATNPKSKTETKGLRPRHKRR